jgi:hypothetical protein
VPCRRDDVALQQLWAKVHACSIVMVPSLELSKPYVISSLAVWLMVSAADKAAKTNLL